MPDLEFEEVSACSQTLHTANARRRGQDRYRLSHLGLDADIQLAKNVPGIDVIVGGHSHNRMTEAKHIGDTLIVQAGAHSALVFELMFHGRSEPGVLITC